MEVMSPLLGKLSTLLENEDGKLKGLQSGITSLRDELSSMKAALEDLSQLEKPSAQVKEWMRQLRELSYDIEDCIDVFVHDLGQDDAHGGLISKITGWIPGWIKTIQLYHHTAGQIAKLKEHAVEVNDRRKRLKLDAAPSDSRAVAIDPRLPALFEEVERLVGVDGPKEELVKWLIKDIDSTKQRRVISIVGLGGLGKTTLANVVYKEIKSQFYCTAFVSVSRTPDIKKILKDILLGVLETSNPASDDQKQHKERIRGRDLPSLEVHQLIDLIREYLKNYRYFVVIDDIWSKGAWESIQYALPHNNCASRIMTTTRINDVAKSCCFPHEDYAYYIQALSSDDSRRLFFKRTFGLEKECSQELKVVADEILKKCGGLPLAIINIASLLATKAATQQEWKRVLESIGFALEQDNELELVKRVLLISYCDLPHHLKICLLYLSVFPEDHIIFRSDLIWKWMAEGFIVGQQDQNLEEVGERYFNELINRNMIQLVDMDNSGRAIRCRVHDIILDVLISLSTEENFVTILNGQKLTSSTDTIRRLSLQGNGKEHSVWLSTNNFSHVRSLTVFGHKQLPPLKGLQTLRVLDLVNYYDLKKDDVDVEDIGSLHQLRYLRLAWTNSKVPRQIEKLQLLQTLDLSEAFFLCELPAAIVQLHQLVRLFVDPQVKFPNGISKMRALQELSWFSCGSDYMDVMPELGNLINLKVLRIFFEPCDSEKDMKSLVSSLCKLGERNLQTLEISGPPYDDYESRAVIHMPMDSWCPPPRCLQQFQVNEYIRFHRIPKIISSFSTLMFLDIRVERVQQEDLQPLKDLPVLVHLGLSIDKSIQETLTISRGGFQCLKDFDVELVPTTSEDKKGGSALMFEEGAMPKLQKLRIRCHAQGVGPGSRIQHLTSLKHLRVFIYYWNCSCGVEAAEAAIRNVVNLHPNHPTLEMEIRHYKEEEEEEEEEEEANDDGDDDDDDDDEEEEEEEEEEANDDD